MRQSQPWCSCYRWISWWSHFFSRPMSADGERQELKLPPCTISNFDTPIPSQIGTDAGDPLCRMVYIRLHMKHSSLPFKENKPNPIHSFLTLTFARSITVTQQTKKNSIDTTAQAAHRLSNRRPHSTASTDTKMRPTYLLTSLVLVLATPLTLAAPASTHYTKRCTPL